MVEAQSGQLCVGDLGRCGGVSQGDPERCGFAAPRAVFMRAVARDRMAAAEPELVRLAQRATVALARARADHALAARPGAVLLDADRVSATCGFAGEVRS